MYVTPLNTFTVTTWETVSADKRYAGYKWTTDQFVGPVKVNGLVSLEAWLKFNYERSIMIQIQFTEVSTPSRFLQS